LKCFKSIARAVFFIPCLPQAIALQPRYHEQGLAVIGVATAFEDFDKNTLENLQRLLQKGEVIGDNVADFDRIRTTD